SRPLVAAAIGNLIRNACLYTDQGTVSVSIDVGAVLVRDTGRGLPAAVLAMLAEDTPGQRLSGSEGTGLGLALVKRICRQLNATLQVSAHTGGGTLFRVNFPAP
ncbi:MAG: ATP-binding protein, partial [Telluria sp.]